MYILKTQSEEFRVGVLKPPQQDVKARPQLCPATGARNTPTAASSSRVSPAVPGAGGTHPTHHHSLECRASASSNFLLATGCRHQRCHQINPRGSRPSQWNNHCSKTIVFPSLPSSSLSSILSTEPVLLATRLVSSPGHHSGHHNKIMVCLSHAN